MEKAKKNIKEKYLKLKKGATTRKQVDNLLEEENREIEKLFHSGIFNRLKNIVNAKAPILLADMPEVYKIGISRISGIKIDLLSLTTSYKITDKYEEDKSTIRHLS